MYSVDFDKSIIEDVKLIDVNCLIPHEQIISHKAEKLIKYIESFNNDDIIISSILCCSKTFTIIDGHHRYFALKKLGFKKIPTTLLNYFSKNIKTDFVEKTTKQDIVKYGEKKILLTPKSTCHVFYSNSTNSWEPIILLSSLFKLKTQ